jgi:threonine/homoserine/homoserine lactone efflux protein
MHRVPLSQPRGIVNAFLLLASAALPFVLSPGASFTMTVANAAKGDRLSPVKVWVGTAGGIAIIASVAGLSGLGALVMSHPPIRLIFGIVGGCVLAGFGVFTLVKASQRSPERPGQTTNTTRLVLWSFAAVMTNVKALSLYVLVVPTISVRGLAGFGLYGCFAAVHMVMQLAWLALVGVAVLRLPGAARSGLTRRILTVLGGCTMIALAAFTVMSSNM